jgi:hypothetical protein
MLNVMEKRWPVRPDVIPGETLSSWLRRIGCVYSCSVEELLKHELGFSEVKTSELDVKAPCELLTAIAVRAGLPVETIEGMTLPGTVPFLFQPPYTAPDNGAFGNCSVLFESNGLYSYEKLTQWFRKQTKSTVNGCRYCLSDYPDGGVLLGWMLKVVLSCPVHSVMLEPGRKSTERINWVNEKAQEAPTLVCQLDSRTLAALAEGFVQLPGGLVSKAQWFRLLQTIFQELNAPLFSGHREHVKWQLKIWNVAEYYPSGPLESFKFDKRCSLLIATAIDQMEKGKLTPTGSEGQLFLGHERAGDKAELVQSTSENKIEFSMPETSNWRSCHQRFSPV